MRRPSMMLVGAGALVLWVTARPAAVVVPGYAIVGARVVTVSGPTFERATVVIRDGAIEAVGRAVDPPRDVQIIEGEGLTVYPGLIDLYSHAGVAVPATAAPQNPESREISERWRRRQLLQGEVLAADYFRTDAPVLEKMLAAGITNAVVAPAGSGVAGQSALVHLVPPELDPQVSRVAVDPRGAAVVRTPVALHVSIPERGADGIYPASLMGGIAFVRQAFLDARHYHEAATRPEAGGARPPYDPALAAMAAAVERRIPVAFQASTPREIRRALALAKELSLDAVVLGAHGAGAVASLLAESGASVILGADYPERPSALGPESDEPLADVQARADARSAAADLAGAGVRFGFGGEGLKEPKGLVAAVRVAVENGLSPEAGIRALTLDAAAIAGAGDRLGAIDTGRLANLVVTDGDLLEEKTKVKHVFVEGRRILLP